MPARGHSRVSTNPAVRETAEALFGEGGPLAVLDPRNLTERITERIIEKTTIITAQARDKIRGPLFDVLSGVAGIVKKAAPAALAACASKQYSDVRASFASFLQPVHLRSKFLYIGQRRSDTIGYPLEQYRILNTLSGFTSCQNVKLDFGSGVQPSQEEVQLIKQYLEAGCYIE